MTQREPDSGKKRVLNGMFSVLIDPDQLGNRAAFEAEALGAIEWVQASPPQEGVERVQIAGEAERAWRAERSAHGVPVDATTWREILDAAASLGVDPATVHAAAGLAG
jgi:uncharacterized oxidoreductase